MQFLPEVPGLRFPRRREDFAITGGSVGRVVPALWDVEAQLVQQPHLTDGDTEAECPPVTQLGNRTGEGQTGVQSRVAYRACQGAHGAHS